MRQMRPYDDLSRGATDHSFVAPPEYISLCGFAFASLEKEIGLHTYVPLSERVGVTVFGRFNVKRCDRIALEGAEGEVRTCRAEEI